MNDFLKEFLIELNWREQCRKAFMPQSEQIRTVQMDHPLSDSCSEMDKAPASRTSSDSDPVVP